MLIGVYTLSEVILEMSDCKRKITINLVSCKNIEKVSLKVNTPSSEKGDVNEVECAPHQLYLLISVRGTGNPLLSLHTRMGPISWERIGPISLRFLGVSLQRGCACGNERFILVKKSSITFENEALYNENTISITKPFYCIPKATGHSSIGKTH